MRKIFAVLCLAFILNGAWTLYRSGISNTFLLNLGFIIAAGTYAAFCDRLIKIKWLNYTIAAVTAATLGFGIFIMAYGQRDTTTFTEDVAIVLGAGIRPNEEATRTLARRLDKAITYHHYNPTALIIVSGGIGNNHTVSEAEVMARYLKAGGIPPEQIIQEGSSHSTYQNMQLSNAILTEIFPEGFTPVVITNDFHIYRSIRFTRIAGMQGATSFHGTTPLNALPGALIREITAIIKMWLIGT